MTGSKAPTPSWRNDRLDSLAADRVLQADAEPRGAASGGVARKLIVRRLRALELSGFQEGYFQASKQPRFPVRWSGHLGLLNYTARIGVFLRSGKAILDAL